VKLKVE